MVAGMIAIAGTSDAQWRHFGETEPAPGVPAERSAAERPSKEASPDDGKPADNRAALPSLASEIVTEHNLIRARVGAKPLAWSDHLAAVAREWAEGLLFSGKFEHPVRSAYGINLFEITGATARPSLVVRDWAGEAQDYNYESNTCRAVCGHYTQVVWNDTKAVGCAMARGGNREVWVCEYDPPGNWVGQRPY